MQKRIADRIATPVEPAVKVLVKGRSGLAHLCGMDELRICEAYMAGSLDVVGDMLDFVSFLGALTCWVCAKVALPVQPTRYKRRN